METEIEDLRTRLIQITCNFNYLMNHFEELHDLLCPDELGTWQESVEQVMAAIRARRQG